MRSNRSHLAFFVLLTTVVAVLCTFEARVFAQEPLSRLEDIVASGKLRVGTTADFLPFSYRRGDSDNMHGVDIAFARTLADAMGVDVTFVETSWPTLTDDLLAGHFDVGMSGITITPARQEMAFFSRPTMASGKVAIARDADAYRFRTLAGINQAGVRVIVNPGGTNESFAREHFPRANILLNEENLTVFEKIVAGTADVMVTDAVEASVQELIHPTLEVTNPDAPFNRFEFGILLPKGPWFEKIRRRLAQNSGSVGNLSTVV